MGFAVTEDSLLNAFIEPAVRDGLFAAILRLTEDAVIVVDLKGKISGWNPAAARLYGRSRAQALGMIIGELFVADEGERWEEALRRATLEGARDPWRTRGRTREGRLFDMSVKISPVRDRAGTVIAVALLAREVAVVEPAELRIAQLRSEIQRSKAVLDRFTYIISHDLQEPLRMVTSFTKLFAQRYRGELDERAAKYIHYVVDGAARMQEMLTDLLVFSRITSKGKPPVPVDTSAVLAAVQNSLKGEIVASGATIEVPEVLPTVVADENQLRLLLLSLLSNAIKFHDERAPHIVIRAQNEGERWVFSVADNGIGIDPKQSARIFELFQRLHVRGTYEGTGAGLAFAKQIVERHGGEIWCDSALGVGSTFFFTLGR